MALSGRAWGDAAHEKKKKETCKLMAPFSAQLNVTPKVPVNNNNIHHGELLSKGSPTGPAELPF